MQKNSPQLSPPLEKMLGHREQIECVVTACKQQRMHHAWLITGPRGVGKGMFARQFAKWLLQANPLNTPSMGFSYTPDDPGVSKVQALTHPDFMLLDASLDLQDCGKSNGNIIVDEVRAAASFSRKMPVESHYRVLIVDSVDDMNFNAANALLKLLEEPPENMVLILLNHVPGKVLPTIRSRCYCLKFKGLSLEDFSAAISKHHKLASAELQHLHMITGGAVGTALEALELELLPILSSFTKALKSGDMEQLRELIALCKKNNASINAIAELLLSTLHLEIKNAAGAQPHYSHLLLDFFSRLQQAFADAKRSHLDIEASLLSAFHSAPIAK